jgi:hypothetical protein
MKTSSGSVLLRVSFILMLMVMFLLPFFTFSGYSIIANTLDDMGAQSVPNAWVMNLVFVALAAGSISAGWGYFKGFILHRIVLALFALSLVLMAFFNHVPASNDSFHNISEDGWHSYFASTAGLSFIILSIATSFIMNEQHARFIAMASGISVFFLSVLMSEVAVAAGIWQRLIYIISFAWMIHYFKPENNEKDSCNVLKDNINT